MHPCRMLKDAMREINNTQDFECAISRFLDWLRHRYDEDVNAGRIKPIPTEDPLVEAA